MKLVNSTAGKKYMSSKQELHQFVHSKEIVVHKYLEIK